VSKTLDYFSHRHLNYHLPPLDANAATSDRLRRPRGVASAFPAERGGREIRLRERARERDLAVFWGGARPLAWPPLGHGVVAQATPGHLGWLRSPPQAQI
jgi:hypothetical protein